MNNIHRDIICQVLACERSEYVVLSALEVFLGDYEATSPDNDDFAEMISTKEAEQTFYWHGKSRNFMMGANLTSDDKLVMSLTFDATEQDADEYLEKLKSHLKSDIGVTSSPFPAEFSNGQDFELRYGSKHS